MRGWGQRPLFRIRPGEDALDALLAARGYAVRDPTLILAAPVGGARPPSRARRAILGPAPLACMAEIWAAGGIGPAAPRGDGARAGAARATSSAASATGRRAAPSSRVHGARRDAARARGRRPPRAARGSARAMTARRRRLGADARARRPSRWRSHAATPPALGALSPARDWPRRTATTTACCAAGAQPTAVLRRRTRRNRRGICCSRSRISSLTSAPSASKTLPPRGTSRRAPNQGLVPSVRSTGSQAAWLRVVP